MLSMLMSSYSLAIFKNTQHQKVRGKITLKLTVSQDCELRFTPFTMNSYDHPKQ